MNNGNTNTKQRRLGGVTGKGFMPGKSGNPKGRPRTRGLVNALKAAIAEVRDGRTVESLLVQALIEEALHGRNRLAAITSIFDRLEGKPKQQLDVNDITKAMAVRTPQELEYFAVNGRWPEASEDTQKQRDDE